MKSRQLANVLIKMLGLSVCIYAIPNCVSNILIAAMRPAASSSFESTRIVSYAIGCGVQFGVGLALICLSRTIAGWMFKNEAE